MERELRPRGVIRIPGTTELLVIIIEYLWVLTIVLNGNSVYNASAMKDYHLLEWSLILTVLLLLLDRFTGRIRITAKDSVVAVGLLLYGVVYISARQDTMAVVDFAMLFCCGLPSLYLLFVGLQKRGTLLDLIYKIADVVFILALISLFFWVFSSYFGFIRPNMSIVINWGYTKRVIGCNGIHFLTQLDSTFFEGQFVHRNSGIFAEAPMFNLWLNIALMIEIFLKPKVSKRRVVVLVITVLTTMSVTGILFLALCMSLWVLQSYREQSAFHKRLIIALLLLVLIPLLVALVSYSLLAKSDTKSYDMRLADYIAGVKLWWEHPIFGGGYANLRALQQYSISFNGAIGFSNSITAVLGTGGLWMSALFGIPMIATMSTHWTRSRKVVGFSICYLMLFCTTSFSARFIAVVMLAFEIVLLQCPLGEDG